MWSCTPDALYKYLYVIYSGTIIGRAEITPVFCWWRKLASADATRAVFSDTFSALIM